MSTLITVSAASGTGKERLIGELLKRYPMYFPKSWTTRESRSSDQNAKKRYHHCSGQEFNVAISHGDLAEWSEYAGYLYGTPKIELEGEGNILVEIEVNGAMKIKSAFPHTHGIFILPPSIEELVARIGNRGSGESQVTIDNRMQTARVEVGRAGEFDYWFLNEDFDLAVSQFQDLVGDLVAGRVPSEQYRDNNLLSRIQALFR